MLKEQLEQIVLPRKSKLSKFSAAEQTDPFIKALQAHSVDKSAINVHEST